MMKTKRERVETILEQYVEAHIPSYALDAIMQIFRDDDQIIQENLHEKVAQLEQKVSDMDLKLSKLDRRLG